MHCRSLIDIVGLAAALLMGIGSAAAFDDSKYPNLKGQWERFVVRGVPGQPSFDQTKGWGALQGAPLTPEYQAIFEENVKDQDAGGLGLGADHARCVAAGMPFMMVAFRPLEFIVTPETTYIIIADYDPLRRIFTDGRDWPKEIEPTYQGYSIGKWIDTDGDGKYDVLEVETRGFKGPRIYEIRGLPLHRDNQSVFKERFYLDKVLFDMNQLVERASRIFCESTLSTHYATLVCGRADKTGAVEICNAGHLPPLLLRGGDARLIEANGLPVGIFCNEQFTSERFRMESGDTLFLFTDGLSESRDHGGEEYTAERLRRLLCEQHELLPAALIGACLSDVADFRAGTPKHDDLTVMALRRAG